MLKYKGGQEAKGGFYLKKGEWEIATLEGKTAILPGGAECEYIKLPALLFVPRAMVMGALYVMFLPFIGFAMLFKLVGGKAAHAVRALATGREVAMEKERG